MVLKLYLKGLGMKTKIITLLFLFNLFCFVSFSDFKVEMFENKKSKYDGGTYHLFITGDNTTILYYEGYFKQIGEAESLPKHIEKSVYVGELFDNGNFKSMTIMRIVDNEKCEVLTKYDPLFIRNRNVSLKREAGKSIFNYTKTLSGKEAKAFDTKLSKEVIEKCKNI